MIVPRAKMIKPYGKIDQQPEKMAEPREKVIGPHVKTEEPCAKMIKPHGKLDPPLMKMAEPREKVIEPHQKIVAEWSS